MAERQEGSTLSNIRKDHLNRYQLVVEFLQGDDLKQGLDCFCGNGYGSNILGRAFPKAQITSYDASTSAIRSAKQFYRRKNIQFIAKTYPFELPKDHYDFVVSLESVEHVEMYVDLLKSLISSLTDEGHLFISVPNEDKIPHHLNKNPYHVKHFTRSEMLELIEGCGGKILAEFGQDCYTVTDKVITGTIDPEDMGLYRNVEGQFMIFVIRKNGSV